MDSKRNRSQYASSVQSKRPDAYQEVKNESPFFSKLEAGNVRIQPKVKFSTPKFFRKNPIERVLENKKAGFTTPVFEGKSLIAGKGGGQNLFNAIRPRNFDYDPVKKEALIKDYDINYSAEVIELTDPGKGNWRKYMPGKTIKTEPKCANKNTVPVVLEGQPNSKAIAAWISSNEQEHVDDLKALTSKHISPFYKRVRAMRGKAGPQTESNQDLVKQIDPDNTATAKTFLADWVKKISMRDANGNHSLKNDIRVKNDPGDPCIRVLIKSSTK